MNNLSRAAATRTCTVRGDARAGLSHPAGGLTSTIALIIRPSFLTFLEARVRGRTNEAISGSRGFGRRPPGSCGAAKRRMYPSRT